VLGAPSVWHNLKIAQISRSGAQGSWSDKIRFMPKIELTRDANAYRITLTDPPLHILDIALLEELRDVLATVEPDRHCLILDAQGEKAFSAGASVHDHLGDRVATMLERFHDCIRVLARRDLVTVALVRGAALGGGCEVSLHAARIHAAAEAYMRGVERRIVAGLDPKVDSVASIFVSRWDAAVSGKVPGELNNKLGIAIAMRTYKAARDLLSSSRWHRIYNAGAFPQRLLWASTGTKDPTASDVLYVKSLAAPFTVNTMPEATLKALASHDELGSILPADGGNSEEVLSQFAKAGIDIKALAAQLQDEGAKSFVKSWKDLMSVLESKAGGLERVAS